MPALITDKFRVYNAKQFLESFDEAVGTEHFFFVGRSKDWASVVEYFGLTGTAPSVGDTITITTSTGSRTASILSEVEGAWLVSGLDPAVITDLEFGRSITFTGGSALLLKARASTEDEPLRPVDNLKEKFDYYREIIAAKRIYKSTLGDGSATASPDQSYVSAVIPRIDFGFTELNAPRTAPYDMWRHDYSATPNFTRRSQGATGEAAIANLDMIVRNEYYEVFMCIDNNYTITTPGAPGVGGLPASAANGPRYTNATIAANADTVGFHLESGTYRDTANYRWKYLYTLTTTDVLRFQSQKFIPLAQFNTTPGPGGPGVAKAIVGPEVVSIINPGTGWTAGTYYTPINGDGQKSNNQYKICKFVVSGGGITSARVLYPTEVATAAAGAQLNATEYTYASVDVANPGPTTNIEQRLKFGVYTNVGLTTAATAGQIGDGSALEVVIPPQGGYGSVTEGTFQEQVNAKRVMCNIRLTFDEGQGDFPVSNDFRRIGLLRDPKAYNGAGGTDITLSTPTVRNTYAVVFDAGTSVGSNFIPDEEISQTLVTSAGRTITAKATVVEWLPVDPDDVASGGILRYYQDPVLHRDNGTVRHFSTVTGDVATANPIVGEESGASGTPDYTVSGSAFSTNLLGSTPDYPASVLYPEIEPYTGEIIYVENRRLITRAADQIEDIKLVIEF